MILILLSVRSKERGVGITVSFSLRSVSYISTESRVLCYGERGLVCILTFFILSSKSEYLKAA